MRDISWSELLLVIVAVTILIKFMIDRYKEVYGGKK